MRGPPRAPGRSRFSRGGALAGNAGVAAALADGGPFVPALPPPGAGPLEGGGARGVTGAPLRSTASDGVETGAGGAGAATRGAGSSVARAGGVSTTGGEGGVVIAGRFTSGTAGAGSGTGTGGD